MKKSFSKAIIVTLCIISAAIFLLAGIGKLDLNGNMQENFTNWGYGNVLLIGVGIFEVLGAIFLFVSKLRVYGVYMLIIIMIGATITHFRFYDELGMPFFSVGLIAVLIIILVLSKKKDQSS